MSETSERTSLSPSRKTRGKAAGGQAEIVPVTSCAVASCPSSYSRPLTLTRNPDLPVSVPKIEVYSDSMSMYSLVMSVESRVATFTSLNWLFVLVTPADTGFEQKTNITWSAAAPEPNGIWKFAEAMEIVRLPEVSKIPAVNDGALGVVDWVAASEALSRLMFIFV